MVLLLVIGMLIALGMIYRFNTAFKQYTTDMFGTYYRCLLETGELPGVASVCRDRKARFDIANGRELVRNVPGSAGTGGGSGGAGGSGSGGGRGGAGAGGEGGQNNGSSGNSASSPSGGGGGGSESVGGSSRSSGGGSGSVVGRLRNLGRQRSTAVGQVGGAGGDENAAMSDTVSGGVYGSRATVNQLRRPQTKMAFKMDSSSVEPEARAAVTAVTTAKVAAKSADRGDSLRPRKTVENTNRKPAESLTEDKGGGLEFGRLFRIFLIIVIIVAIVVFLGGQVLQISKSSEQ